MVIAPSTMPRLLSVASRHSPRKPAFSSSKLQGARIPSCARNARHRSESRALVSEVEPRGFSRCSKTKTRKWHEGRRSPSAGRTRIPNSLLRQSWILSKGNPQEAGRSKRCGSSARPLCPISALLALLKDGDANDARLIVGVVSYLNSQVEVDLRFAIGPLHSSRSPRVPPTRQSCANSLTGSSEEQFPTPGPNQRSRT